LNFLDDQAGLFIWLPGDELVINRDHDTLEHTLRMIQNPNRLLVFAAARCGPPSVCVSSSFCTLTYLGLFNNMYIRMHYCRIA
jgi:hypothetical protein